MPRASKAPHLAELERLKLQFGAPKLPLVRKLGRHAFRRARDVERFHEALTFLRAYPDDPDLLKEVESLLIAFHARSDLRRHRAALADTGIAGTSITYTFFAPTALWLATRWPSALSIDWENVENAEKLRRLLPLLALESEQPGLDEHELTEREWLDRLRGPGETDATFLVRRLHALPMSNRVFEVTYEDLALPLRLAPGADTPSTTRAKYSRSRVVYPTGPVARTRPKLPDEIHRAPVDVRLLDPREGAWLIDLAREAMVTRSRDLDAFAYGDPEDVRLFDFGDGLELACIGTLPDRRLLLEAVYGFLILRNGVPISYALASALFRSSEVAYNVFETFRGADTAWVYGRVLATVHHLFQSDSFTVYPYQLGHENEEGLESGAWWFYQKLGFRPRDRNLLRLMNRELERMRARPKHRSSLQTLKTLSSKNVYYFVGPPREDVIGILPLGSIGLAVTGYLAERFGSERERARQVCSGEAARLLGVSLAKNPSAGQRLAWERWSPLILILKEVARWSEEDKGALVEVVRAKGGRCESDFVTRFDRHLKLRRALTELARRSASSPLRAKTVNR